MKRIIVTLLLLCCLLVPCMAYAWEDPPQVSGDYQFFPGYTDYCDLYCYTGQDADVIIPSEIDGYRVTGIGEVAFTLGRNTIRTITLPAGLTWVYPSTFRGLEMLEKIVVPASSLDAVMEALGYCPGNLEIQVCYNDQYISTTAANAVSLRYRNGISFWGSFTLEKTYSFDHRFFALQTADMNALPQKYRVTVYETATGRQVAEFCPTLVAAHQGICWESDTYNIWVQASFAEYPIYQSQNDLDQPDNVWILINPEQQVPFTVCYQFDGNTWCENPAALCPSYIISKFDPNYYGYPETWSTLYVSPTDDQ